MVEGAVQDQVEQPAGRVMECPLLVDAAGAASLVGLGQRTIWRLLSAGHFPAQVQIPKARGEGKKPKRLWRRAELEQWVKELEYAGGAGHGH